MPNSEGKTGEDADDTSKTETQKATPKVEVKDDKVVLIDGKPYVIQDHVDSLVGTARTEGKAAGKTEAEKALQRQKDADDAKNLQEQGKFEDLYKTTLQRVTDLEGELAEAQRAATEATTASIRAKVAAKYKLPEKLAARIQGANEAEMDADAKEIADEMGTPKAPDTQSGQGGPGTTGKTGDDAKSETQQDQKSTTTQNRRYGFQTPGEVSW